MPIIDIAYCGLGGEPDDDLKNVRRFLSSVDEALICVSASKSFGLYRELTGCLLSLTASLECSERVSSQIDDLTRAAYSMPPAHGAAIVALIANTPSLSDDWIGELRAMRARLADLRAEFARSLQTVEAQVAASLVESSSGMFCTVPLKPGAARRLKIEKAIYLPESGRINLCGLCPETTARVANAISKELVT